MPEDIYASLEEYQKKSFFLGSAIGLLHWDQETNMPRASAPYRAEQVAYIAGLCHKRAVDPCIGEWLDKCEDSLLVEDPESVKAVNIREWRRDYNRAVKIPQSLVEEIARTSTLGHSAWIQAREHSDFKEFLPYLEKLVGLKREVAEAVGYKNVPYDALLDEFEPGEDTATVTGIFEQLKGELVGVLQQILESGHFNDNTACKGVFHIGAQRTLGCKGASLIGFDFQRGRVDTVTHPFCTRIGPDDVRISTRYNPNYFPEAFFGILHESGHGLYEQGLEKEYFGTPMGSTVSLAVHESQSRLWENLVGRSYGFWKFFYPQVQSTFQDALGDVPLDFFYSAVNAVHPSFIRVEADEVTYNLHIILRFEIEQALISGEIHPREVPDIWNSRFEELFGLKTPDDKHGCLQDVHWAYGMFGYFPTYCLGNLYAAQFFETAEKQLGNMEEYFIKGEFKVLREWLLENIHCQGMKYKAPDLCKKITGSPLNHKPFIAYLRKKYLI